MINRSVPPGFSNQFKLTLPTPTTDVLANGISLCWHKDVEQEVTKIELVFHGGKWAEPKNGISFFTATLFDKGTASKSAQQIAEAFDQLGAQIECASGLDYLTISLYSLNRNLSLAWNLLTELLTQATFPEAELAIQQSIQIQNLKINNEKNSFVASKLLRKNIFGKNHPYGRFLEESDITTQHAGALKKFFQGLTPSHVFITGNIGESDFKSVTTFLEHYRSSSILTPSSVQKEEDRNQYIEKKESVQSAIRLGKIAPRNSDADFAGLLLLNHLLGGYFGSRLMKNIREEKGLTYGIYSSLNTFAHHGMFSVGAEVNKENTSIALMEIFNEMKKLQEEAVTVAELTVVKNHLAGSLQLELANPFSVVDKLKNIHLNKLPADYYDTLLENLQQSTPTDLQRLAQQYLSEDSMFRVTVG